MKKHVFITTGTSQLGGQGTYSKLSLNLVQGLLWQHLDRTTLLQRLDPNGGNTRSENQPGEQCVRSQTCHAFAIVSDYDVSGLLFVDIAP
jgi:hypothetical protein